VLDQALADQELFPARTADALAVMLTTPPTEASSPAALLSMTGQRPIQRPKDREEPQECCSGKKQCHTLNNLLVLTETCHVSFLSHTWQGRPLTRALQS
jgi:DDE superfamily endonuclease